MNNDRNLLAAMAEAIESGGIPVAMIPYQGDPPDPEFYLELLRDMIISTGGATGAITFGTLDLSGMLPLTGIDAELGLNLLLHMRRSHAIESVTWVVVADDALRRMVVITPEEKSVSEEEDCLMVTCVVPDGPGWLAMQPYTKTPSGVIVWGDIEDHGTGDGGVVVDLMTELVTA